MAFRSGSAPFALIARREKERSLDRSIFLPPLIDAAAIEKLGELPAATPAASFAARESPRELRWDECGSCSHEAAQIEPGEILVCSTLDPNLTPLFLHAGGLIVERGGALSHAAIVAREMSLPVVVLPEQRQFLRNGMTVALDGSSGCVRRIDSASAGQPAPSLPAELVPPPPSRWEATSSGIRNVLGAFWCLALLAVFVLPRPWGQALCLVSLDVAIWPVVVAFGKFGAVAAVAVVLAFVVALAQRLLTDNRGLRIAKSRSQRLALLASKMPDERAAAARGPAR